MKVFLSSTAQDLVAYRQVADDTILRLSQKAIAMERFGPLPGTPADECERLARESDVVVCIVAHRYGFEPEKGRGSITRREVEAAKAAGNDVLVWIVADDYTWTEKKESALLNDPTVVADPQRVADVAAGVAGLMAFKTWLRSTFVCDTFTTPDDLAKKIAVALSTSSAERTSAQPPPAPKKGEIRIVQALQPTPHFQGRHALVKDLTDWVADPASPDRVWSLVAAGGTGKTALAWHWWNEIAPQEMKPLAGRMWWSFSESDARLENFTARALAYLTGKPRVETEQIAARDREDQLLGLLDREPHLVVLDGLERELVAYARVDAAHLSDDDLDAKTAHTIVLRAGLPEAAAQSFVGEAKLRQTADPRTGHFLRRLMQVRAARILITTRLLPSELEDFNGDPLPGACVRFLPGLTDDDAVALWRSAGITGARDALVPMLRSFDRHPLLVRALAGEIARDRRSPADFDKWKERHRTSIRSHYRWYSAGRMYWHMRCRGWLQRNWTCSRRLRPSGCQSPTRRWRPFLSVPETRGRSPRRMPSIERSRISMTAGSSAGTGARTVRPAPHCPRRCVERRGRERRQVIAERMRAHFEPMPAMELEKVERLEDLTPAIELYVSLIRLGRFEEALEVFRRRLGSATVYLLGASRHADNQSPIWLLRSLRAINARAGMTVADRSSLSLVAAAPQPVTHTEAAG